MIAKIADKYGVDLAQALQPQPEAEAEATKAVRHRFKTFRISSVSFTIYETTLRLDKFCEDR